MKHIVFQNLKSFLLGLFTSSKILKSDALRPIIPSMKLVFFVLENPLSLFKLHYLVRVFSLSSRKFISPHASTGYFPKGVELKSESNIRIPSSLIVLSVCMPVDVQAGAKMILA